MKFSTLARPPIQQREAEKALTAICPNHDGLIAKTGDKDGTVFFCPLGGEYWRYAKQQTSNFKSRLSYGREVMV